MAEEQHHQLGGQAHVNSTGLESKTKNQERTKPRTPTALVEVANISWKCSALLKEAVFNTVPHMVNVMREVATQNS